jgi:hypothetical protein
MKKFITAVLCLGLLFSASNGYSVLPSQAANNSASAGNGTASNGYSVVPSQEDNKRWNINIPKIEITDGMKWSALALTIYAAYKGISAGFGDLTKHLVAGIGHCGTGVLGIGNGLAEHPYIFISAGIIVGGIATLDYCTDAPMFNKMKSGWKYLWGASN